MAQPRQRTPSFALLLLLHELYRVSTHYGIPPVTLATIGAQIAVYLRLIKFPWDSVWDVCISVDSIVNKKKYLRLILSQIEHADDWHLYYNMVSFMWKGRSLEKRMGASKFILLLCVFTVSTALTYVGVNQLLAMITNDKSYLYQCSVGFSGVIFALKVLTTHYDRSERSYFMGIPIMSKYAVWVELILIQLLSPNASFTGHLAGIFVGLMYVHGPLKKLLTFFTGIVESITNRNVRSNDDRGHRLGSSSGNSSSGHSPDDSQRFFTSPNARSPYTTRRRTAFYQNYVPSGMSEDEQLRRATEESLRDARSNSSSAPSSAPSAPSSAPSAPQYYDYNSHLYPDLPYPTDTPAYSSPPYPSPPYPTESSFPDSETLRRIRLQRYESNR